MTVRIADWNPNRMDSTFENIAVERLVKAAKIIRAAAKRKLAAQIGKGRTTGISRPVYRSGKDAGKAWTAREFGQSMKSVRVVRKKTPTGRAFSKKRNVRVYSGHFLAFYADIFEFYQPFMRPAFAETINMVEKTIGVKK